MRHDGHAKCLSYVHHLTHLGDPANLGDARLCVCDRSHLEHALEVRGCRVLTRRDCKSARGAHTSESDMILWWPYRLFEPGGVESLELVCHRDRLVHRPRTVGIDGDRDVGPG